MIHSGVAKSQNWKRKLFLGGTSPYGEAFLEFQKTILKLKNKGFLVIVSKNEEKVAIDAIENHPEMLLRKRILQHSE